MTDAWCYVRLSAILIILIILFILSKKAVC